MAEDKNLGTITGNIEDYRYYELRDLFFISAAPFGAGRAGNLIFKNKKIIEAAKGRWKKPNLKELGLAAENTKTASLSIKYLKSIGLTAGAITLLTTAGFSYPWAADNLSNAVKTLNIAVRDAKNAGDFATVITLNLELQKMTEPTILNAIPGLNVISASYKSIKADRLAAEAQTKAMVIEIAGKEGAEGFISLSPEEQIKKLQEKAALEGKIKEAQLINADRIIEEEQQRRINEMLIANNVFSQETLDAGLKGDITDFERQKGGDLEMIADPATGRMMTRIDVQNLQQKRLEQRQEEERQRAGQQKPFRTASGRGIINQAQMEQDKKRKTGGLL